MIVKLGGIKKDGRGRSFKRLFQYVLHDKQKASTSRRVEWREFINCGSSGNITRAWFEMMLTWENRFHLKRAAGVPLTGRDNERPVLHLTLSWHPTEHPTRSEMMQAAIESLAWLDLSEHQAIVVAHNDEPHPHVHIVVNTVHPVSGMTVNLYQSKKSLSAWAANWEERHGGIIVEARPTALQPRKTEKALPKPARLSFAQHAQVPAASNDNTQSSSEQPPRVRSSLRQIFMRVARSVISLPLSMIFRKQRVPQPPLRTHAPLPEQERQFRQRRPGRGPALRM